MRIRRPLLPKLDAMTTFLTITTVLASAAAVWFWWRGRSAVSRREAELGDAHSAEIKRLREAWKQELEIRKRAFAGRREKFEQYRRMLDDHRERLRTGRYTKRAVEEYLEMYEEVVSDRVRADDAEVLYSDAIQMLNATIADNLELYESIRSATAELKLFVGEVAHERLVDVEKRIGGDFSAAQALLTELIEYVPEDLQRNFRKVVLSKQQALDARADVLSDMVVDLMTELREELSRA